MALATWPTGLPGIVQDSFRGVGENNVAEFRPEVGPPMRWRRSTAKSELFDCAMDLTSEQYEDLDDFYWDDLEDGSLPFVFPAHPMRPSVTNVRMVFEAPINWAAYGGAMWTATFRVRVLP